MLILNGANLLTPKH